jgi:hypothetical protein
MKTVIATAPIKVKSLSGVSSKLPKSPKVIYAIALEWNFDFNEPNTSDDIQFFRRYGASLVPMGLSGADGPGDGSFAYMLMCTSKGMLTKAMTDWNAKNGLEGEDIGAILTIKLPA